MNSANAHNLVDPLAQIFSDRAEADWAFDFLRETVKGLGIRRGAYDPRFALTLTRRGGQPCLHLNFGGWLVAGFCGPGAAHRVELTLLADRVAWEERLAGYPFDRKEGQPEVRTYHLSLELIKPMTADLRAAYEASLAFIAAKFEHWQRPSHWQQHQPELVEALFDLEKRGQLFAGLLLEPGLSYERHFTAFPNAVAEGGEEYEVDVDPSVVFHFRTTKTSDPTMKTFTVEVLDGIKPAFQNELFEAMRNCTNQERLLVCMYFHSDLPDEDHTLETIEANLRKIFPPSLQDGKTPETYVDFQASAIRGYLGDYDRRFKKKQIPQQERVWKTVGRGRWRNTQLGNQQAIRILKREGIRVKFLDDEANGQVGEVTVKNSSINPIYPLPQLAADTGFDEAELTRWLRAIERKKQAIIYGPPGTGKTFLAEKLAGHLIGGGNGFWELVQFHPAYAYEDFIQGIRPEIVEGHLSYQMTPGRFLEFCRRAEGRDTCVLIIDEINRANLARVLGELMYLLEYRDREIPLAGGGVLKIPANLRLIGTMNTADRSIALVDHALRRRFAFIELKPNYELLRRYHQREQTGFPIDNLIKLLQRLNRKIDDPHYEVGVTFFLRRDLAEQLADIWEMEIVPYLEEYFFDRRDEVALFRWATVAQEIPLP